MTILQNDVSVASQRASELAGAVRSLSSSGSVNLDGQTTLIGNTQSAHQAIALSQSVSLQMGQVIDAMCQNIQSVSSSFQAMDSQLGQELSKITCQTRFSLND